MFMKIFVQIFYEVYVTLHIIKRSNWGLGELIDFPPLDFFFYQQVHIKDSMHASHSFFLKERSYHCAIIIRYQSVGGLTFIAQEFAIILNILFVICHPLPVTFINFKNI